MAIQVTDNIKWCCGVSEVYGITLMPRQAFDSEEVIMAICAIYFFKFKKGVYVFEDVDAPTWNHEGRAGVGDPTIKGTKVKQLADYIQKEELGIPVLCPPTINPNSSNVITVLNWVVDRNGLERYWTRNEPQANEKDWLFTDLTSKLENGEAKPAWVSSRKTPRMRARDARSEAQRTATLRF